MSKTATTNKVTTTINGRKTEHPLNIRDVLEAARSYRDRASPPGDTMIIDARPKTLSDIIERNMSGRMALARPIVNDLFEEEVAA